MPRMSQEALRVLVVDDTVVYRRVLQNVVAEVPGADVVGIAANGKIALEKLAQIDVDLVLLDVEMPELDGIETLREIRKRWPSIGVVLLSGADRRAADVTMTALSLGALDFVAKADTGDVRRNHRQLVIQITAIVRAFVVARNLGHSDWNGLVTRGVLSGGVTVVPKPRLPSPDGGERSEPVGGGVTTSLRPGPVSKVAGQSGVSERSNSAGFAYRGMSSPKTNVEVLLIGSSTGGPQALAKLIPGLPADLGIPVLVVQHMPPVFTTSLAESLNRSSKLRVVEAFDNQTVAANIVYVAPGGRHMLVRVESSTGEKRIVLSDEAPVNSVRPAVDVLFLSAAQAYGGSTISVILTGMGEDGCEGVRALRALGGFTLTQSAKTCVVYGMPRAVEQSGLSDESVPLANMASRIAGMIRKLNPRTSLPIRGGTD